jgi:hypothetical protein
MVRQLSWMLVVACLVSLAGCGKSNDKIADEVIAVFDGLTAAVNSGDKAKVKAAVDKMTAVLNEHKSRKISASEKKRLEPRMMEAGKRMQAAMVKAMTEGKITQQEMMEIANTMMSMKGGE